MNEKSTERRYSPLTYAIYDELKKHVDSENGISADKLAQHFGIDKRLLRYKVSEIRNSPDFELCILSSNSGYFVCSTKDEFRRHHRRLYSMAFSLLKEAREQDKKMGLNGQYKISLNNFDDFFKAFAQDE